jgi:hypothetical protein
MQGKMTQLVREGQALPIRDLGQRTGTRKR